MALSEKARQGWFAGVLAALGGLVIALTGFVEKAGPHLDRYIDRIAQENLLIEQAERRRHHFKEGLSRFEVVQTGSGLIDFEAYDTGCAIVTSEHGGAVLPSPEHNRAQLSEERAAVGEARLAGWITAASSSCRNVLPEGCPRFPRDHSSPVDQVACGRDAAGNPLYDLLFTDGCIWRAVWIGQWKVIGWVACRH